MGTRALVHLDKTATIYCHWDGYPKGLGNNLKKLLKNTTLVNGYTKKSPDIHNTEACLWAWVVAGLKHEHPTGYFYLYPPRTNNLGEDWIYTLEVVAGKIWITVALSTDDPDHPRTLVHCPIRNFFAKKTETLATKKLEVEHGA